MLTPELLFLGRISTTPRTAPGRRHSPPKMLLDPFEIQSRTPSKNSITPPGGARTWRIFRLYRPLLSLVHPPFTYCTTNHSKRGRVANAVYAWNLMTFCPGSVWKTPWNEYSALSSPAIPSREFIHRPNVTSVPVRLRISVAVHHRRKALSKLVFLWMAMVSLGIAVAQVADGIVTQILCQNGTSCLCSTQMNLRSLIFASKSANFLSGFLARVSSSTCVVPKSSRPSISSCDSRYQSGTHGELLKNRTLAKILTFGGNMYLRRISYNKRILFDQNTSTSSSVGGRHSQRTVLGRHSLPIALYVQLAQCPRKSQL